MSGIRSERFGFGGADHCLNYRWFSFDDERTTFTVHSGSKMQPVTTKFNHHRHRRRHQQQQQLQIHSNGFIYNQLNCKTKTIEMIIDKLCNILLLLLFRHLIT